MLKFLQQKNRLLKFKYKLKNLNNKPRNLIFNSSSKNKNKNKNKFYQNLLISQWILTYQFLIYKTMGIMIFQDNNL